MAKAGIVVEGPGVCWLDRDLGNQSLICRFLVWVA